MTRSVFGGDFMTGQKIKLDLNPMEFFRKQVLTFSEKHKVVLTKDLEFYVVNLLCQFVNPSSYLEVEEEIDFLDTPLVLVLKKALEAAPDRQIHLYKLLGDTSLYLGGVFEESLAKKSITKEYVITMGSQAYANVAELMKTQKLDADFRGLYASLASSFPDIMKIISSFSHGLFKEGDYLLLPKQKTGILDQVESYDFCHILKKRKDSFDDSKN